MYNINVFFFNSIDFLQISGFDATLALHAGAPFCYSTKVVLQLTNHRLQYIVNFLCVFTTSFDKDKEK